MTYIGLLDCNNFFVSCERLFRPDLRTRPTVVLSSNDGCVVARSQEIKDMGIPMGVPYFQVKDTLQKADAAVFSSNFTHYRDISRRVFAVMREVLDTVEQYSIDEAFFTLEAADAAAAEVVARRVKERVERCVGIPVSLGLAASKTQAKHANHLAKKTNGVRVLDGEAWTALAPTTSLGELWGVGAQLVRRYERAGLRTVADLLAADPARVDRLFGVGGVRLRAELAGEAVFPVVRATVLQQSIMSSRSFRTPTTDPGVILDAVAYHVRQVLEDLRGMHATALVLRVMIRPSRHGDYALRGGTREVVLEAPSADTMVFMREATRLARELFESGVPYQKAGVMLAAIRSDTVSQGSLFAAEDDRAAALMGTIDGLNRRFGREKVVVGARLRGAAWGTRRDRISPSYTTRWSDLATVSAGSR